MPFKFYLLISFFILTILTKAQSFSGEKYGLNLGLHIAAGTHFDRIGISCIGYYVNGTYQVNPGFKLYYNFKNIGPIKKYFEFAPSVGAIISFGKDDSLKNLFISPVGNQTIKRNSVGYAFNYYLNNIKTSQATGTISLEFGKFQIIGEDDLLQEELVTSSEPVAFSLNTVVRISNTELIFLPVGQGKEVNILMIQIIHHVTDIWI